MNTSASTAPTPPGGEARPQRPDRPVLERDLESFDEPPMMQPPAPVSYTAPPRMDAMDPFAEIDAIDADSTRLPTLDDLLAGMPPGPTLEEINFEAAPARRGAEDHRSSGAGTAGFRAVANRHRGADNRAARRHANAHARSSGGACPEQRRGACPEQGRAGCPDRRRGGGTDVRPKHHRGRLLRAPGRGTGRARRHAAAARRQRVVVAARRHRHDDRRRGPARDSAARARFVRTDAGHRQRDRVWRRGTARPRRNRSHQAAGRRRRGAVEIH